MVEGGASSVRTREALEAEIGAREAAGSRGEDLVNGMLVEALQALDIERARCAGGQEKAQQLLQSAREAVAQDQDHLFGITSASIAATGEITNIKEELDRLASQRKEHEVQCSKDISDLRLRLRDLAEDQAAVLRVMSESPCKDGKLTVGFLQVAAARSRARRAGDQEAAREGESVQFHNGVAQAGLPALLSLFDFRNWAGEHSLQVAFQQATAGRVDAVRYKTKAKPGDLHPKLCDAPGRTDCQVAEEAVILLAAAMQDQQEDARRALSERISNCKQVLAGYASEEARRSRRRSQLEVTSANLVARKASIQEEARLRREELVRANQDLKRVKLECDANVQAWKDRLCELRQMRSDLVAVAMGKVPQDIQDCEVSPWIPEACTASCGGGTQRLKRRVVKEAGPQGAPCPKMEDTRPCATMPCPVDCRVSEWGQWTGCSSACGGGTRTRSRSVEVAAQYGGEPCPEENSISAQCSVRPCDAVDCTPGDWGKWSTCSRACGGGLQQRARTTKGDAALCPVLPEEQRLQYLQCNKEACPAPVGQQPLRCDTKLDVAIVLDGGGGCGTQGFKEAKEFVSALISALDVGEGKTQVALALAGGSSSWDAYQRCLGGSSLADCNVKLALPLTADSATALAAVDRMEWPGAPSQMAGALAMVGGVLSEQGRQDAQSLVLVVARGRPLSAVRTKAAADALRVKARVTWALLGEDAPAQEASQWASQPTRDNVLLFATPAGLATGGGLGGNLGATQKVSDVIATVCPKIAQPAGKK